MLIETMACYDFGVQLLIGIHIEYNNEQYRATCFGRCFYVKRCFVETKLWHDYLCGNERTVKCNSVINLIYGQDVMRNSTWPT